MPSRGWVWAKRTAAENTRLSTKVPLAWRTWPVKNSGDGKKLIADRLIFYRSYCLHAQSIRLHSFVSRSFDLLKRDSSLCSE
jgi:hypothetical protein